MLENSKLKLSTDQTNSEASQRLDKVYSILNDLENAKRTMAAHDYQAAIELLTAVLEVIAFLVGSKIVLKIKKYIFSYSKSCPWSTEVHEYRSECYLSVGDVSKAILDINALAKLIPDNTKAYQRLSELHYSLGDADLALK